MRHIIKIMLVVAMAAFIAGCGGAGTVTPSNLPVSIEGLDGTSDVAVDSSFKYTFPSNTNCGTVTSSSFFIVQAACGTQSCNPDNALPSTISCASSICELTPDNALECNATHCICMTTDIQDTSGNSIFDNEQRIEFTTAACTANPTVSTVADGDDTVVATTGSTDVNPNSFDITFSQEMDDTSVTTAGNITLSCQYSSNTALTPTISAAASSTAKTYTVTVADGWKYALMTCTLTIGTNVTNSDGLALAEAATYQFTNACAISDDFNANSESCWTPVTDGSLNTWALLEDILTFNTSNSLLDYSSSSVGTGAIYKQISMDDLSQSSSFEIIFRVYSASDTIDNDLISLYITGSNTSAGLSQNRYFQFLLYEDSGIVPLCFYGYSADGSGFTAVGQEDCSTPEFTNGEMYMKLTADSLNFTLEISSDGVNYRSFATTEGALPLSAYDFLKEYSDIYLMFHFLNASGNAIYVRIDSVKITNFTSSGQY